MISQLIERFTGHSDYEALRAQVETLTANIDKLVLENAYLKHENARLRRRVYQLDRQLRLIRGAHVDANVMAVWYLVGASISRRACNQAGMPIRRWARARAMLHMARLLDENGLKTSDPASIQSALAAGLERSLKRPEMFKLRCSKQ